MLPREMVESDVKATKAFRQTQEQAGNRIIQVMCRQMVGLFLLSVLFSILMQRSKAQFYLAVFHSMPAHVSFVRFLIAPAAKNLLHRR